MSQKEDFISYEFDKNGNTQFPYSIIASENPLSVQYFEPTVKGKCHSLNEDIFPVFPQDMREKVSPPKTVKKGNFINTGPDFKMVNTALSKYPKQVRHIPELHIILQDNIKVELLN